MTHSPVRALVGSCLRPYVDNAVLGDMDVRLDLFDAAAELGAEAVTGSGLGLDHFRGERVLAAAFTHQTPRGTEHRLIAAITDRRTAISGWSSLSGNYNGRGASLAHAEIVRVETKDSVLARYLTLFGPSGKHDLLFDKAIRMLDVFYRTLLTQVPPEARCEPPTSFLAPAADDPSGARGARQSLFMADQAAAEMLDAIERKTASGSIDAEVGKDLAGRVVLAHRARSGGPGMADGTWISPMSSRDLGMTLVRIFGPPRAHAQLGPGVDALDFVVDPARDPVGVAMKALGIASYVALGVGFSPARVLVRSLMKRAPVRDLRITFGERHGCSGFQLHTPVASLERHDALFAHRLHQALIHSSYAVLARRIEAGWEAPYESLFAPQAHM